MGRAVRVRVQRVVRIPLTWASHPRVRREDEQRRGEPRACKRASPPLCLATSVVSRSTSSYSSSSSCTLHAAKERREEAGSAEGVGRVGRAEIGRANIESGDAANQMTLCSIAIFRT